MRTFILKDLTANNLSLFTRFLEFIVRMLLHSPIRSVAIITPVKWLNQIEFKRLVVFKM